MESVFRDPVNNRWLTNALFWETASPTNYKYAIFTLMDKDVEKVVDGEKRLIKSFKHLYLECNDPTEYVIASKYLGGWSHWKRISNASFIQEYLEEWREELEVSLRSQGVRNMAEFAAGDRGMQAAKWLAEKGWVEAKRGAPSKAEKAKALKIQTLMKEELESDLERLRH